MLIEIDRDFYCSAGCYENNYCLAWHRKCPREKCPNCHRKHPTPKQYKDEYGRDVSENTPVWVWVGTNVDLESEREWLITTFGSPYFIGKDGKYGRERYICPVEIKNVYAIVVACTPYGKPDDNWRPE